METPTSIYNPNASNAAVISSISGKRGRKTKEKATARSYRKRKTVEPEIRLPPIEKKLEIVVPESKLYNQLVEFEKRIDSALTRKRAEIQEAGKVNPSRSFGTLNIKVYHNYSNQEAYYHSDTVFQNSLYEPASWTLKIEGNLDDVSQSKLQYKRPFTSFFKKVFIQLDKTQFPDNDVIEWHKPATAGTNEGSDGFEVKRLGSTDCKVKIVLHLDYNPPMYKLSPALSEILKLQMETRPKLLIHLWQYIKMNKLQDPDDKKTILLNPKLREIFGCEKMTFHQMPQLLSEHLSPPDPIEIDYDIMVSGESITKELSVQVPQDERSSLPFDPNQREIDSLNQQIADHVERLHRAKKKREFMLNFVSAPVQFMNQLITQQIRDAKILNSEAPFEEEARHSGFFYQPLAQEACSQFLSQYVVTHEKPL